MAKKIPKVAGAALFEEAEKIMAESKRIVPVDTGALRSSGFVDLPRVGNKGPSVRFGYGSEYSVFVHEIPPPPQKSRGGRSARHRPPTQWKFLEQPFKMAQRGMLKRLARRIKIERA